jgi:hypothetical protein
MNDHDAIRAEIVEWPEEYSRLSVSRADLAALLADRDALERERDHLRVVIDNGLRDYMALEADRGALDRDLAAARELLRMARDMWVDDASGTADLIDAHLAATPEREPGAACTCIHPPGHPREPAWGCPVHS